MSHLGNVRATVVTLALAAVVAVSLPATASAQGGPFQYYSVTPCRVADTRTPTPTPIADGATRAFVVQGVCGVPVGAKAVSVNITAVGPTNAGYLTAYPTGITRPVVASLTFNAGESAIGNGGIVPLADQATHASDMTIFARVIGGGGTTNVVIDVTGYFQ